MIQLEMKGAETHFPNLVFKHPGPEEIKVMKRDLAEAADRKLKAQRILEQLGEEFTDEEMLELIKARKASGKKPPTNKQDWEGGEV